MLIFHAVLVFSAMATRCTAFQGNGQVLADRLGHIITRALLQ